MQVLNCYKYNKILSILVIFRTWHVMNSNFISFNEILAIKVTLELLHMLRLILFSCAVKNLHTWWHPHIAPPAEIDANAKTKDCRQSSLKFISICVQLGRFESNFVT